MFWGRKLLSVTSLRVFIMWYGIGVAREPKFTAKTFVGKEKGKGKGKEAFGHF